MFYVGQKVVSLRKCVALEKGEVVTVMAIGNCPKCGLVHIAYDRLHGFKGATSAECTDCDGRIKNLRTQYWFREARTFAPLEEYSDSMSIAMQLVQEIDQVDKAKNPVKTPIINQFT